MNSVEAFLTSDEEKMVVESIKNAEKNTSGEVRVHIEKSTSKHPLERAQEVFYNLNMQNTKQRNGVLLYVATDTKQFAIIGDEGINKLVTESFWEFEKRLITHYFTIGKNAKALMDGIQLIGEKLKMYFPYEKDDTDELSNEISKG